MRPAVLLCWTLPHAEDVDVAPAAVITLVFIVQEAQGAQYMVIIINLYRYYNHIHQDSQFFWFILLCELSRSQ